MRPVTTPRKTDGRPTWGTHQEAHQEAQNQVGLDPDSILDAIIWTGIFFLALFLAWNVTGCLSLYDSAGPYAATYNKWCS